MDCGTDKWGGAHPDDYLQPAGVASVMFPAHLNYMLILAGSEVREICKYIGKYKVGKGLFSLQKEPVYISDILLYVLHNSYFLSVNMSTE